jgi:circadian clock protein KaiC
MFWAKLSRRWGTMVAERKKSPDRPSTGVPGLDEVLHDGPIPGRAYLVRGGPGTGKTTLGLHFLTAGARSGERALLITLEEPEGHLRQNAEARGFELAGVAATESHRKSQK